MPNKIEDSNPFIELNFKTQKISSNRSLPFLNRFFEQEKMKHVVMSTCLIQTKLFFIKLKI